MIRIISSIDRFRGDSKGPFSRQFTSWCFAIARNTLYAEIVQIGKRNRNFVPQNLEGDNRSFDETISDLYYHGRPPDTAFKDPSVEGGVSENTKRIDFNQFIDSWFGKNLTDRQRQIVALRHAGKGNSEIAAELGFYRSTIGKAVMKIKSKVENDLLRPVKFRPVIEFRDEGVIGLSEKSLDSAIQHGKLKVIRILGWVYTTLEFIGEYLAERRDGLDQAQALNGFVPIGTHASPAEYNSILRNSKYRRAVVFTSGRAYIHPEDLEEIKKQRNQRPVKPDQKIPPAEGYVVLKTVVKTAAESSRYRDAIVDGRLKAIKENGIVWVTPEAINEYNARYKP